MEGDSSKWTALVSGPATYVPPGATESRPCPYAGRKFHVEVSFPPEYPFKRPDVKFRAEAFWHPVVNFATGEMCQLTLDRCVAQCARERERRDRRRRRERRQQGAAALRRTRRSAPMVAMPLPIDRRVAVCAQHVSHPHLAHLPLAPAHSPPTRSFWGPTKMCFDVLVHLRTTMMNPTSEGGVNADAITQLSGNIAAFEAKAKAAAAKEPAA